MLHVKNKKTISNLAKSSLKVYKMRNIFTLITIVLSVSFIAGIAFLSSALQETNRRELSLRQQVIYHQVSEEKIERIRNYEQIKESQAFKKGKSFEVQDYILLPYYIESSFSSMLSLNILEGRYPEAFNEILVFEEMLEKMGLETKIGETISISFLDGSTEEFVVVGLTKSEAETDVFPLYFSWEYAQRGSQLKEVGLDLAVQIEGASKMGNEEFLSCIQEIGAQSGVERGNINPNDTFVRSITFNYKDASTFVLISIAILLVSALVIYSIFTISISERTRQFGQLRTIGMTKKQVKKMVRKEGTALSLYGSCIGIIIGAVFSFSMKPKGFQLYIFLFYSVVIMLANYITVQISIAKPAKIAAGISPIDAAKFSGYETGKGSSTTKGCKRKLSPLSLSMIAARGNSRKSFMTLVSLCLAGIVFMCASTFVSSVNEEKFSRQSWFQFGEYVVDLSPNAIQANEFGETGVKENNPFSSQLISRIEEIDGVKEVFVMKNLILSFTYHETTGEDLAGTFSKEEAVPLAQILKEGNLNYDKMVENKEIIINYNELVKEIYGWEFQLGDTVTLKWYNGEKYVEDTFTVSGILKNTKSLDKDHEMKMLLKNAGWFLLPQELLGEMMIPDFNLNDKLIVNCQGDWNSESDIESELHSLTDKNPLLKLMTLKDQMEHNQMQFNILYVNFMGAALFVIAFSMINLVNTLISNIMARNREYASLGAIGAGRKQIAVMILGEGLYFSAINILVTCSIGSLCGYLMVFLFEWNGLSYMDYAFPYGYMIGYCAAGLLLPLVLSVVSVRLLNQKSLVERLRVAE